MVFSFGSIQLNIFPVQLWKNVWIFFFFFNYFQNCLVLFLYLFWLIWYLVYLAIFIAFIQIFFNDSMPCKNWSACLKTVREKRNWECSIILYFFYLRCLFWRYLTHKLTAVRKILSTPEQKLSHQFWKFWTTRMHLKIFPSLLSKCPSKGRSPVCRNRDCFTDVTNTRPPCVKSHCCYW